MYPRPKLPKDALAAYIVYHHLPGHFWDPYAPPHTSGSKTVSPTMLLLHCSQISTGDGVGRDLADQVRYGTVCTLMADDANLEEPAGRVFRQVGARGPSKSADNMRKKGLNHFERFLSEKRLPPYEDLSPDLITI